MTDRCQECNRKIFVEYFVVNDDMWEKIKPSGNGLLCGHCIIDRLEALGEVAFEIH